MAKHSRKSSKGRAQSPAALRQNGLSAFKRGDYGRAIEIWELVARQAPTMRPTSALAEAYFRRGLKRLYAGPANPQDGLRDMERAVGLQPGEPRYAHHLGLAAHHQGDLDQAIRAYRAVRKNTGEFAERAAYPLALALLQSGQDPAADPVWPALSTAEQALLSQTRPFRRRPYALSPEAPQLWHALAALDAGDRRNARAALDTVLETSGDPVERGMAHYYRGVLAARDEDWDQARRQWSAAHAAGLDIERLTKNLGELYHRLAEDRLAEGDAEGALAAAQEALRHQPGDRRLRGLFSQAHQRVAYQAATAGQWAIAHDHWEAANAAEGGSFRLAYNLALAYERAEDFYSAGETWRDALRRRPRRADHPDAINDEQVAQLWRRSAESYRKAGEYDEAVHVYRQAVKWNPGDLETRLALSEALLANGQVLAAGNELERILGRDPDNIPALLRQGEVVSASGRWWQWNHPTSYWERVLVLEPDNREARQLLADFYQDAAEFDLSWGNDHRAVEMYQRALDYQPQNGRILAAMGGCYLRMGDDPAASAYFENALAGGSDNLDVYNEMIHAWFDVDRPDRAWEVLENAETTVGAVPYEFYLAQASYCIAEYIEDVVRPWLERAIEKAPPGVPVLIVVGEMAVMGGATEIGREYLERAIALDQEPGQAYLMLGIMAAKQGENKTADRYWKQAERIAHTTHDEGLKTRVQEARLLFSGPPGLMRLLSALGEGPFGDGPFPDFFEDEFDDDDDEFF